MSQLALDLQDVWVSFRGTPVLEGVTLQLPAGELLGIIGPNGGGKSTLLKVILGLIQPDRGKVLVYGKPPVVGQGAVAYVPQHARFDASFPIQVMDVVLMGRLSASKMGRAFNKQDRERAEQALNAVQMGEFAHRQIGKLSGGQLQRVLIARALSADARMLLLDEPTASLDPRIGVQIYELLQGLGSGLTVILVSHDLRGVANHASRLACVNHHIHYHASPALTQEILQETYGCSFDVSLPRADV